MQAEEAATRSYDGHGDASPVRDDEERLYALDQVEIADRLGRGNRCS
jgi:hypothetical protein